MRSLEDLVDVILTISGNITALAGSRVRLYCPAEGFPRPSITWQRNGQVLESTGDSFFFPQLTADDHGGFSCFASNVFGVDSSTSYFDVVGTILAGCRSSVLYAHGSHIQWTPRKYVFDVTSVG